MGETDLQSAATADGGQAAAAPVEQHVEVQACGFVLELSGDWLIQRASENAHKFLGEYHVRLVGEPLSDFTMAQPLHDLRNTLARQRSSTGIARAYHVRLTDERRYFDIAFQLVDGRIILEGVPASEGSFGEALGSVSRLIDGLAGDRQTLFEGAARRMRAMTGFDRAVLSLHGEEHVAESSRGSFAPLNVPGGTSALPSIIVDASAQTIPMFPRHKQDGALRHALLRSPGAAQLKALRDQGVRSMLNVPLIRDGNTIGCFSCDNRTVLHTSFEMHAAAELFAQMFAMRLEIEELNGR